MVEHRVHRVIVADSDRFPLGIITSLDALKAFPAPRK
jgi:CBS domain-containing protein